MSNLVLALVCLLIGKLLQRVRQFPASSAQTLNLYVIYVALPALILLQIPKLIFTLASLAPVLVAWLVMGLSAGITWLVARRWRLNRPVTGALLLVVTLGNTSFIGFPLISAYLGPTALPYAILYDQLGTFLALNTLGVAIANHYTDSPGNTPEPLWLKMLRFPPLGALMLGIVLGWLPPFELLDNLLRGIASTLVPVVMVAVGMQWRLRIDRSELSLIAFALSFILVVKPSIALAIVNLMQLDPFIAKISVLEAGMPAMISASALAVAYNLAPRLAATIIGYSLMLCFVTTWVWNALL